MIKLLILEDDAEMNHALCIYFKKAGYTVLQAFHCAQAQSIAEENPPDIIIADIGLPDESGLSFCAKILKEQKIPVLFLTAKDEETDILNGYEAGCEEYVTKPVSPKVLLKKVEVILKRNPASDNILYYQDLKIDYEKRRVWIGSTEIMLTVKEWKILQILSKNKGQIVTKELLLQKIWDAENNFVEEHTVTVVINRLRKKIETDTSKPAYIKNIFGVGYTFGE